MEILLSSKIMKDQPPWQALIMERQLIQISMNIHPTSVAYIIKESNAGKENITAFNNDRKRYSISHGKISS
jgi:hypothetical protein